MGIVEKMGTVAADHAPRGIGGQKYLIYGAGVHHCSSPGLSPAGAWFQVIYHDIHVFAAVFTWFAWVATLHYGQSWILYGNLVVWAGLVHSFFLFLQFRQNFLSFDFSILALYENDDGNCRTRIYIFFKTVDFVDNRISELAQLFIQFFAKLDFALCLDIIDFLDDFLNKINSTAAVYFFIFFDDYFSLLGLGNDV